MNTGGKQMYRMLAAVLVAAALVATACTGSATISETGTGGPDRPTTEDPTSVPALEPTAAVEEPTVATEEPTATPDEPTAVPETPLPAADFRTDNILAISNGGAHAYAGTTSPWNTETSCESTPAESLAVVEIAAADAGNFAPTGAGLEQAGDVRQVLVGQGTSAAILSSCGPSDAPTLWLQRAELGSDGRIVALSDRLEMGADNELDPYLLRWVDDDVVEVRVIIEVEPDDYESWLLERRQISIATGEVLSVEQSSYFDDDGFASRPVLTTADGFTYRVIDDPAGSVGCEGFGVARILELEGGGQRRLALTQTDLVFSDVSDLHVATTGHISWTSGCEGYVSAYVGKILADGTIADAHLIDTFSVPSDSYSDFQEYRLTDDGFLVAIGQTFQPDSGDSEIAFLRYDLSIDPNFVNTAQPPPVIDDTPLFQAVGGDGSWHVGETLGVDRACGGKTLYGQTSGGFVRAFPAGIEIDAIVDVDLAETRTINYEDGGQFVSRTVVVQTECPGAYDGRRVWFGLETDNIIWGLWLDRADLGEVADVLSVRDVLQEGTEFVETTIIEVELFDGTVVEVELVGVPFDG